MDIDPHLRRMRTLAWICVLLMLVVTSASAWLRLAQARPVCVSWPECRSVQPGAAPRLEAPSGLGGAATEATVRAVHRVAATIVLLLILALTVMTLRQRARLPVQSVLSVSLLALALGLSVLGIVTPGSRSPGVVLGNLLGGLLMLGLCWSLARSLSAGPTASRSLGVAALACSAVWGLQAGLGGLSGAALLDIAPILHLILALLSVPGAFGIGLLASRRGHRREGMALIAVTTVQALLGGAGWLFAAAPATVLAHNLVAATGLALLIGLAMGMVRTEDAPAAP